MKKVPQQLLCAIGENHIFRDPIMLDCEDYICKKCIPSGSDRVFCTRCCKYNKSDLNAKRVSKLGTKMFDKHIGTIFKDMLEEFKNSLSELKSKDSMKYSVKWLKDELDRRNKSMKEEIDKQTVNLKSELDSIQETYNKYLNESEIMDYEFKLNKLGYLVENNLQTKSEFYEFDADLHKIKSITEIPKKMHFTTTEIVNIGQLNKQKTNILIEQEMIKFNEKDGFQRPWSLLKEDIEPIKPLLAKLESIENKNKTNNQQTSLKFVLQTMSSNGESSENSSIESECSYEEYSSGLLTLKENGITIKDSHKWLQDHLFIHNFDILYVGAYYDNEFLIMFINAETFLEIQSNGKSKGTKFLPDKSRRITVVSTASTSDTQFLIQFNQRYGSNFEFIKQNKAKELLIETFNSKIPPVLKDLCKDELPTTSLSIISASESDIIKNKCLNNKVIDSYLMHLQNEILNFDFRKHVFIFKSEFYEKLTRTTDKNDYSKLKEFRNEQDLFQKEFILIPFKNGIHWSLIIICYPTKSIETETNNLSSPTNRPIVILMDPLNMNQSNAVIKVIKYLEHVWYEKEVTDAVFNQSSFKFIFADVPQEESMFDSGVFMLAYAEDFLKNQIGQFHIAIESYQFSEGSFNEYEKRNEIQSHFKTGVKLPSYSTPVTDVNDDTTSLETTNSPQPKRFRRWIAKKVSY